MEEIADILKYQAGEVTTQELLDLTVDDLTFEELDENIFIELVQAALKGEAHKEGNYDYLPQYALLTEPEYLNDYKFQVGFVSSVGCIDVILLMYYIELEMIMIVINNYRILLIQELHQMNRKNI